MKQAKPLDVELYNALKAYKRENKITRWWECLTYLYEDAPKEARPILLDFRNEMTLRTRKDPSKELLNWVKQSYLLSSQDNFSDFMVAVEWNRAPNARFWLPRMRVWEGQHKICTRLQEFIDTPKEKMLTLSCPPGTGKSTLIKFLLAYIAGREPTRSNMYCSYADGMVKVVYDSVVAIMTDRGEYLYHEVFPGLSDPLCSAEYSTISFRKKGDVPTLGLVALGGSVTGRTRANNFFVTDDLVKNDEVAKSPERLNKLFDDYSNTLTTRMVGDNTKQICLGTIWSLYDPISRLKEKNKDKKGYHFISIPVCDENGRSNFCFDHTDRYTDESIADLKARLDPVTFSCLYMQQGVQAQGLAFPENTLKFYNGELPAGEPDNICFFADVAWGGTDSFAMPIAYIYGEDVYIHDVLFDNRDKSFTRPRVLGKILQHNIKMGCFEANNGGAEYCDHITTLLKDQNYIASLSSKFAKSTVAKVVRIEQYQNEIRNFYFRDAAHRDNEYMRFMAEVNTFSLTGKNLHDDAPDSLAGLAEYLNKKSKAQAIISNRPF